MHKKVKSKNEIINIVRGLKKRGKKVVTINGAFDILHIGHVNSLEKAKAQGDILIVLVNSDQSVKSYKGPRRPIIPQKERAEILAALGCVDYVTVFNEINPKKILNEIGPSVHCSGLDWGKYCAEKEVVEKNGGRIHVMDWKAKGISTTRVIQKVLYSCQDAPVKAIFLDRDGVINSNKQGYVYKNKDFDFTPYAFRALKSFSKTGYKLIVLTNQSGIGRGYFKKSDLIKLNKWMVAELKGRGIKIDKIYYCPHLPQDNCACRKPNIGMVMQAVNDFNISLNESWIIGDSDCDVMLGREVNMKTIKVGGEAPTHISVRPHYRVNNLLEALGIILGNIEN